MKAHLHPAFVPLPASNPTRYPAVSFMTGIDLECLTTLEARMLKKQDLQATILDLGVNIGTLALARQYRENGHRLITCGTGASVAMPRHMRVTTARPLLSDLLLRTWDSECTYMVVGRQNWLYAEGQGNLPQYGHNRRKTVVASMWNMRTNDILRIDLMLTDREDPTHLLPATIRANQTWCNVGVGTYKPGQAPWGKWFKIWVINSESTPLSCWSFNRRLSFPIVSALGSAVKETATDYVVSSAGAFAILVKWTWSRPWDITRVIFAISRYLPFIGSGLTVYDALSISGPPALSQAENISLLQKVTVIAAISINVLRNQQLIAAITVTNVIIDAVFPVGYTNMFDTLQVVIHSVLGSRIMFHLRSSHDQVYEMHSIININNVRSYTIRHYATQNW
ncbi:hypothetical protein DFJ58DRAFT_864554 [Suillus subalutaceus]|uniref:uncharacterized protein n=1 Tax=Suillus subalutaceus TaxID=48586 RepID=UPI001B85D509|nr:uncharacterized protein DFJ58DRAFT_864554 [Suillus subalutaceus]KAG1865473.1 hypothetical protein DFJ58DRAFT_864554 [Suillus subalutaceus]